MTAVGLPERTHIFLGPTTKHTHKKNKKQKKQKTYESRGNKQVYLKKEFIVEREL